MSTMAEAAASAFGAAIGVLIAMAVVVFGLRGKGHSRSDQTHKYSNFQHFSYFSTPRLMVILHFYVPKI